MVNFVLCVNCLTLLSERDTHQRFQTPSRTPAKTILSPSGDQLWGQLWPRANVNCTGSPPLLGMIAICVSSPRFISKAKNCPSGDQHAQPANSRSKVNCFSSPPVTGIVATLL